MAAGLHNDPKTVTDIQRKALLCIRSQKYLAFEVFLRSTVWKQDHIATDREELGYEKF
jgi:hypothetical protein